MQLLGWDLKDEVIETPDALASMLTSSSPKGTPTLQRTMSLHHPGDAIAYEVGSWGKWLALVTLCRLVN